GERACSIREAVFAPHETMPARDALGRVCGAPTVACPPAIPIAVSGEVITREALSLFAHYGIDEVDVIRA
ncbi:MAG: amino acid decarboxylase, partial [Clostridiales bacterium]|nr:amino acid decarboxylase [Clostridiales bacterium]